MKRAAVHLMSRATLCVVAMCGLVTTRAVAVELPTLLCSGKNDHAPVYLFRDVLGASTRMEVTANKDGRYQAEYVKVSGAELLAECANGVSIAALPTPLLKAEMHKDGVPTQSSLPSSFTIMTSTTITCKYGQPPPSCRRTV